MQGYIVFFFAILSTQNQIMSTLDNQLVNFIK